MMAVFLTILKIAGIILLVILGLIVLILGLVLLVPVRYRVSAEGDTRAFQELRVSANVTYLLHLVKFCFALEQGEASYSLKLLFFRLLGSSAPKDEEAPEKQKQEKAQKQAQESAVTKEQPQEQVQESTAPKEQVPEQTQEKASEPAKAKKKERKSAQPKNKPPKDASAKGEEKPPFTETLKKGFAFLGEPENKYAFHLVKQELLYLLKHYMPKKLHGELTFSADKPDMTGKLLGVLALFPVTYRNGVQITPDFETAAFYVSGRVALRGRIRLVHLLKSAVVLVASSEFRRMIKQAKDLI